MKKLKKNTISSFIFQITTIICGMILPRLLIQQYGSEVNGLTNSISQFLGIISFLDLGVSRTVQSALYKPLVERNKQKINEIITSAASFFRRLAQILLFYVFILLFVYPLLVDGSFGILYTVMLLIAMSISSFAQYYFGVVDQILLIADQRGYIQYTVQTVSLVLNTVFCIILISCGASIQMVKLTTSLIYLIRPLILRIYVNRHYNIDRRTHYDVEPIDQKWDGLAQHIAMVVYESTDTIILTVGSTLENTSIYSVYNLVIHGLKLLVVSMTNGIQSFMGELWARQDREKVTEYFGWMEWSVHTGTVFVFGCAGSLILPFVKVYTNGITDVNYIQPLFALLVVLAGAGYCIRLPYNIMILAAGYYRQTRRCYTMTAMINIVVSLLTVYFLGLVGVAIGTLAAIIYQVIWMVIYNSKSMMCMPVNHFVRHVFVDIVSAVLGALCAGVFTMETVSYISWGILAVKSAAVWAAVIFLLNFVFYPNYMRQLFANLSGKIRSLF